VQQRHGIRLLEEGVWRLVRRGEEHDTPCVGCETLDDRRGGRGRGGPDEEDGTRAAQCRVERFGHGEVAGDDFHVLRQRRRFGAAGERADRHARVDELADDGAPDPAGRPGDEHRRYSRPCHEDLGVIGIGRTGQYCQLG
jgi:hypothetical protein